MTSKILFVLQKLFQLERTQFVVKQLKNIIHHAIHFYYSPGLIQLSFYERNTLPRSYQKENIPFFNWLAYYFTLVNYIRNVIIVSILGLEPGAYCTADI